MEIHRALDGMHINADLIDVKQNQAHRERSIIWQLWRGEQAVAAVIKSHCERNGKCSGFRGPGSTLRAPQAGKKSHVASTAMVHVVGLLASIVVATGWQIEGVIT